MKHRGLLAIALFLGLFLAATAPLFGGTVYVPLVVEQELEGHRFTSEIRVTNQSDEPRAFTYLFVPQWTDGTVPDREAAAARLELEPRQSLVLTDLVADGTRGMLEITADAEVSVTSRLVSITAEGEARVGAELPVVTSRNAREAGATAVLQGWQRDGELETHFFLLNLGHERMSCDVAVYHRRGDLIAGVAIDVPPLALGGFEDALGRIGEDKRYEASATVSCDRPYHPFALTVDRETAEAVYIVASGTGRSTFEPPGVDPGPPPAAVACPRGALFEKSGVFHRPKPGEEVRRFDLAMPADQLFSRLVVDVEFVPGDWATPASGNHAVFWLNRTERWAGNVLGYVNVFGPDKNIAKIATNAGLRRGDMRSYKETAVFEEGVRYHVHYELDTARRVMEAIFTAEPGTANEREVARVQGAATINSIRSEAPGFFLYFGHPAVNAGPEVPTYGWTYLNLCVQLE